MDTTLVAPVRERIPQPAYESTASLARLRQGGHPTSYFATAIACYFATTLIVLLGVGLGEELVSRNRGGATRPADFVSRCAMGDGRFYVQIAEDGYIAGAHGGSYTAFFPAFPLLGRIVARSMGIRADLALLIVAHASLLLMLTMLTDHLARRFPDAPPYTAGFIALGIGLLPTTFYLRMAYSESLFLCATVAVLSGIERRWPLWAIAAIVGFATATRPVGVALLVPWAFYVVDRCPNVRERAIQSLTWTPVACWGILAFMAYQWWAFDDPFSFVRSQWDWGLRPPGPLLPRIIALATGQPLWGAYVSSDPGNWARHARTHVFTLSFANPIFFLLMTALTALGARRGWLRTSEWALSAALLLIPYCLRGYEMQGGALGRFSAVALPAYFVLGHLLARVAPPVAAAILALCAFFLGVYAAVFSSGEVFY
jgi:hypothetical protein